ncbi:Gfo/Idh/MocA family protein [Haladaptatus halobius]|uniref:Gfo/Idh/MocA family protein n=1 Tax=Haladaptatus halobius TaxID=2884875 RepID=UPI001D0AD10F|nr:Gfo/Idh/MocA family oxidoreductase [Haladaptatus halobius]
MPPNDPVRAAVVGCGGAGRNHAVGYRRSSNAELIGVCDLDAERAAELEGEHDVPSFDDLSALMADLEPDVVSVATPEKHHVEPTITALQGGADVLCEKIMAESVVDGQRMVEVAEETGRTLAVDYNYRHMPSFRRIADAIDKGELGDVHLVSVDVHAYGWHHVLDLLVFLLGEPKSVRATLNHDPTVVEEQFRLDDILYVPSHAASVTLDFDEGTFASVSASIHTSLDDHLIDLAVYADGGRVRLTGMTPSDSTGTVAPGPLTDDLRNIESNTLEESFESSVEAFVDAIQASERPPTTGADGLRRLELERAVVESAESEEWISL